MPVVPRYDRPRVGSAPLPNVGVPSAIPAASVTQPPPLPDLSGVTRYATHLYEEQRQKADQVAVLDADNQLAKLRTDLYTDATNRRGKEALGATDAIQQRWTDGIAQIEQGLSGDRQRLAFRSRVSQSWAGLYEAVERHAQREARAYDDETTASALSTRIDDAASFASEPAERDRVIQEGAAIIADYARRNGVSPERLKEQQATWVSKAHLAVIGRLLADGNDLSAKDYYDSHAEAIRGDDATRALKAVRDGSTLGESQRQADQIVDKVKTLDEALHAARVIEDPEVRDATEQRIRRHFLDVEANDRQARESAFEQLSQRLEQTHDVWALRRQAPDLWAKLSPSQRTALEHREDDIRHPQVRSDMVLFTQLVNEASLSPETQAKFLARDMTKIRGRLSESDYKYVVELQARLRFGNMNEAERARRSEERAIVKQGEQAQKMERSRAQLDSIAPGAAKYLPPPARVVVPRWMVDSAQGDPEYRAYLEAHGVDVGEPVATPATPATGPAPTLPTVRVPGGPLLRPAEPQSPPMP